MRAATIGFFDGVHRGHQFLCRELRGLAADGRGQTLVITFAEHPQTVVGPRDGREAPRLLTTTTEKTYLLESAMCGVDAVEVLAFDRALAALTAREFMEQYLRDRYGVTHLLVGYDHRFGRPQAGEGFEAYRDYGRELGIEVVLAGEYADGCAPHVSSSAVRRALAAGDVDSADRMLGYDYALSGNVVEGHHVGRDLGFPTANLAVGCARKLIPGCGVYVTSAYIGGRLFPAVTNVGHRPTLDNGPELSVETHLLLDSEGADDAPELYGLPMTVTFHQRLRDEQRFDSLDALRAQIAADRQLAIEAHRERARFSHNA